MHTNPVPGHLLVGKKITALALGRGVGEDGELSPYGKQRVRSTLNIVRNIALYCQSATIIWTGGAAFSQVSNGALPAKSEGQAMYEHALLCGPTANITYKTEGLSQSTVENMTLSSEDIGKNDMIVIISDHLHFALGRIRFLAWLVFPGREVAFVPIPSDPNTKAMSYITHCITFGLTLLFMVGVQRGNTDRINRRQHALAITMLGIARFGSLIARWANRIVATIRDIARRLVRRKKK